jgi:hypothetical protein
MMPRVKERNVPVAQRACAVNKPSMPMLTPLSAIDCLFLHRLSMPIFQRLFRFFHYLLFATPLSLSDCRYADDAAFSRFHATMPCHYAFAGFAFAAFFFFISFIFFADCRAVFAMTAGFRRR